MSRKVEKFPCQKMKEAYESVINLPSIQRSAAQTYGVRRRIVTRILRSPYQKDMKTKF